MSSLERVLTVHQTSMGATRLPLELQQQVFSYLDTKSFYAARNVCKWWRFASDDAATLSRQLKKLPVHPPVEAAKSSSRELQRLFGEAAYTLMLGVKVERRPDTDGSKSGPRRLGAPVVVSTSDGRKTVTLNNRTIAVYDTSGSEPRRVAQRHLNDLRETVGNGPWLKISHPSAYELALSSDGSLLAVAQDRTIQMYDLCAEPDSFTVNEYISSAAGHYICGLAFEQDDHVLRVNLSGKGTVLYLGTPRVESSSGAKAIIEHWKGKAGLKHTFLDSTLLSLETETTTANNTARITGLQLLQPFHNGQLFAAQQHGGNESSHYILGHVKTSPPHKDTHPHTAEPNSVTVLARLESFLSSWDYTLNGIHESGMGLWENMPSAHQHHPTFALSPDGTALVLAEREKKSVRPTPLTQIFVYRLPNPARLAALLRRREKKAGGGRWATLSNFLDKLDNSRREVSTKRVQAGVEAPSRYKVGRIPLCLSTVQGVVTDMTFDEEWTLDGRRVCALSVVTPAARKNWRLTNM